MGFFGSRSAVLVFILVITCIYAWKFTQRMRIRLRNSRANRWKRKMGKKFKKLPSILVGTGDINRIDWIKIVVGVADGIESVQNGAMHLSALVQNYSDIFDLSMGSCSLSCSKNQSIVPFQLTPIYQYNKLPLPEINIDESNIDNMHQGVLNYNPNPNLLRVHQMTRGIIRNAPSEALLGVATLVATELTRRTVNRQKKILPTQVFDIANVSITELERKLEVFSYLQWEIEPFLKQEKALANKETNRLAKQPLEAVDKFVVSEILRKVDKDVYPILAKTLVGDPKQAKRITENLKDFVRLVTVLLVPATSPIRVWGSHSEEGQRRSGFERTSEELIKGVDSVGVGIESVINEWNNRIEEFGKVIKSESIVDVISHYQDQLVNITKMDTASTQSKPLMFSLYPSAQSSLNDVSFLYNLTNSLDVLNTSGTRTTSSSSNTASSKIRYRPTNNTITSTLISEKDATILASVAIDTLQALYNAKPVNLTGLQNLSQYKDIKFLLDPIFNVP